jgi:hypothetical protein
MILQARLLGCINLVCRNQSTYVYQLSIVLVPDLSHNILYFLYGAPLVRSLGEELILVFTYFYLRYIDGVLALILTRVEYASNSIQVDQCQAYHSINVCLGDKRLTFGCTHSFLHYGIDSTTHPLSDRSFWSERPNTVQGPDRLGY